MKNFQKKCINQETRLLLDVNLNCIPCEKKVSLEAQNSNENECVYQAVVIANS